MDVFTIVDSPLTERPAVPVKVSFSMTDHHMTGFAIHNYHTNTSLGVVDIEIRIAKQNLWIG